MFKLKKIFENESLAILKIEGDLGKDALSDWLEALAELIDDSRKQVIFDACEISHVCPELVNDLEQTRAAPALWMNCPTLMRNMMHSAGLASRILDL